MSTRRLFLPVCSVVILLGCAVTLYLVARPKPNEVLIEVTGPAGMPIEGTCEVDGTSQELSDVVPATFAFTGNRVTYSLTTTQETGEFRVRTSIDDIALGSSTSQRPPKRGVRGWVRSSWWGERPRHWIESFDKRDDEGWMDPPP
jgi:hypothetical protein